MNPRAPANPAIELRGEPSRIARRIATSLRRLIAGDRDRTSRRLLPRTMVACSGGADSSALLVALTAAGFPVCVGHVVHDMRPTEEALADRNTARALAERVGVSFHEAHVSARTGGNLESAARRERYRALGSLAREAGCPFIATAHHADDQLETMVMSLVRGTGPHGLRGVAARRHLSDEVTLVRPMLDITREECLAICAAAGVAFATDATNADLSRFRSALRAGPIAEINRLRPGASRRAGRTARLMRDLAGLVELAADGVQSTDPGVWDRSALREGPAIVVGAVLRRAFVGATGGVGGDALRGRMIDEAVRIIRSPSTDPKSLAWPRGVRVSITSREVRVTLTGGS